MSVSDRMSITKTYIVILLIWNAISSSNNTVNPEQLKRIGEEIGRKTAIVRYYLRYDNGQAPQRLLLPDYLDCKRLIEEERPIETPGFVLSRLDVVAPDIVLDKRFIDRIQIVHEKKTVAANVAAYAISQDAIFLKMSEPIPETFALTFDPKANEPLYCTFLLMVNGMWTQRIIPFSNNFISIFLNDRSQPYIPVPSCCLIANEKAKVAGITMNKKLPLDNSWKGSPQNWDRISLEHWTDKAKALSQAVQSNLLLVELGMRSPKVQYCFSDKSLSADLYDDPNITTTEARLIGLRIDKQKLLVIGNLTPDMTARLERIRIYLQDGKSYMGTFEASLADYSALLIRCDSLKSEPFKFSKTPFIDLEQKLLFAVEVKIYGNERVQHIWHTRISDFKIAYAGEIVPQLRTEESNIFLFTLDGQLVAVPIQRRPKKTLDYDNYWKDRFYVEQPSVVHIQNILAAAKNNIDSNNIPLKEQLEGKTAWFGAVLQGLDEKLARVKGVSEQTDCGKTGALISYVFSGSPADLAQIRPGMILLRLYIDGNPVPVPVKISPSAPYINNEEYDETAKTDIDYEYIQTIPPPWPSVCDELSRLLTSIGIGKKYIAEFADNGVIFKRQFTIVESPCHFGIAPKYKSEELGLTVKDMTFEVRHYYQKKSDEPGIVVSKVEPGSKAAIAGIRPYEIITSVNGKPIFSAQDFGSLLTKSTELQITVNRMYRTRQVNIRLTNNL